MAEFMDERIQRMLRRERERRTIVDIRKGPVRIGDELVSFAPVDLFEGHLSVWAPIGYADISKKKDFGFLYIWWKPQAVLLSRDEDILFTFARVGESGEAGELLAEYKRNLNRIRPSTIFYQDGEVEADGHKAVYMVFKTRRGSNYYFNICCFMKLEQGALIGTFECDYAVWPRWMEPVRQVMQSIRIESEAL